MSATEPNAVPELSVVIPCFNEQDNAAAIAQAVIAALEPVSPSFDLVFIDNASSDDTVPILRALAAADPRIRVIVNSRNFGQMRSPTHAIFATRGRAVLGICADFQDPPELLPQFVERWRAGADIVLGVRASEPTGRLLGWARSLSYKLAARFGDYPLIPNATGFGLYDRRVVDAIKGMREPEPFFRGMLIETGYRVETIAYARSVRARGKSSNNFFTLLDFALSGLATFSKALLRFPFFLGAMLALVAAGCLIAAPVAWLVGASATPWLIAAAIEAQLALLFGFLGLFGDQLRLVSERTRRTPLVFERERINFPPDY